MEIYIDNETKLTLHVSSQAFCFKKEKTIFISLMNRKICLWIVLSSPFYLILLFDLWDILLLFAYVGDGKRQFYILRYEILESKIN